MLAYRIKMPWRHCASATWFTTSRAMLQSRKRGKKTYVDDGISDHVLVASMARLLGGGGSSFGRHGDGVVGV